MSKVIRLESLLNDYRQCARVVLESATDCELIDLVVALQCGQSLERFLIQRDDDPEEFRDGRRFLESLALPTIVAELHRRAEVEALEP